MPQRLISKLQQSVMGGAIILGVASLCSRVLGLVRDRLLSTTIGPGDLLDSYFTAFKLPDLLFNILVLGILSASFVPVFIDRRTNAGRAEALAMANGLLNLLGVILLGVAAVCYLFAPQLVGWLAYGDPAAQQDQTVAFTRIMLLSLVLFGLSNVLSGILHAEKKFLVYAVAPIFYNLGIIVGILWLVPALGPTGLAFGVVLGAALHLLVQLPTAWSTGFRYQPRLALQDPGLRQVLRLMPPRALALGMTQLNIVVLFAIASTLPAGSRSIWQFADNLQHFPINIFGVSLALAAFPVFSEAFAEKNLERFKKAFSENFRRILFFIIPISIATLLLRAQIVRLVYGAGEFGWEDTILTAQTLGVFALSMFAQAAIPLLARSFFARQDTTSPVVISAIGLAVNAGLAWVLAEPFGVIGLALGFSVAAIVQMLALLTLLRVRHGDLDDDHLINSTWKIIIASLGMGVIIQGLKYIVAPLVDMQTFLGIFVQTIAALGGGGAAYIAIAMQFRFPEARQIWERVRAMWRLVRSLGRTTRPSEPVR